MDFITIPATLAVIGFFTYKLFELFVCKKERLYLLEHIKEISMDGIRLPEIKLGMNVSFSALKWGCLLLGIGLGILVSYFTGLGLMGVKTMEDFYWNTAFQMLFGGGILLFGGLGLVIAFIIEMKLKGKEEK